MHNIKRILVLDDHVELLDIVREVLVYENFDVKSIANSEEVLPAARVFHPDLIIMDCHPEYSNGTALCKALKADPGLSQIPVIVCSAYVGANLSADIYGCDAIIAKPYNLNELVGTVNSLLVA